MMKEPVQNMPQLKFLQKHLIRNSDNGVIGFIAGGCFKSYFMGNKIKDIDIFFPNRDYYEYAVSANEEEVINQNENCITIMKDGVKVDLICSIFGTPEEVLSNFDFTVSKFAIDDQNVYYHDRFFKDITLKKLVIDDKIPKPYSTFTRSIRYSRYGFNLCKESTIKLLDAIRREEAGASVDNVAQTLYGGWD
ncbi:hypothetical protein FACS1894151_08420 [Spirochaetia bacterium]|nr:hypothetical protein FACS1894151_08420 [Spirochaetia bacterium]